MKNLVKISFQLVFVAAFFLSLSSCKDTCYVCTGFDDGTISLEDLGTICEGGDDGAGGTYTEEQLEAAVLLYEGFGGNCTKE